MSAQAAPAPRTLESGMTHREVLEAMSGLLLGMFVAILSSTVVSTRRPRSSATSAAASPPTRGS